ncbi:unnamed protein product [Rotaria socialis]|uniref:Uncharacterized protein n=4 Tax=Rotaria socialis TaxID=392032 RepID=A0A817QSN5_9BILA|nr:unnamed protein product [Rotaria socialis]CAF4502592.1 unnamed protein product [Rotaria socialis]
MLSEAEYYTALQNVHNIPSHIQVQHRQNYTKLLKKQIKEYEYNLKYDNFQPLPYIPYFVNKTTTEPTLQQLIQAATSSSEFIMDTESINIYKRKNEPTLIQIQIILPYNLSLVMIVEMWHLPRNNTTCFTLIKQLFNIIFTTKKIIYLWGLKDELTPFVDFNLFSHDQLQSITPINLQHQFKLFWNEQHTHRNRISTSDDILEENCLCETCIGKKSSEPWSLQDSTAYLLKEYLPKILTREKFNLGLDPHLFNLDFQERQYRQQLTNYALNDCLSMQRILINMKNEKFEFKFHSKKPIKNKSFQLSQFTSDEDDDDLFSSQSTSTFSKPQEKISNQIISSKKLSTPSIITLENNLILSTQNELTMNHPPELIPSLVGLQGYSHDWKSMRTNENNSNLLDHANVQSESTSNFNAQNEPKNPREKLSADQLRQIHNRSCTIKQRRRYYKNELIFENIDYRFSIKQIKMILKEENIPIYIVNTTTTTENTRKLFVAVRNAKLLKTYEQQTQHLFTKIHYEQLKANRRLLRDAQH